MPAFVAVAAGDFLQAVHATPARIPAVKTVNLKILFINSIVKPVCLFSKKKKKTAFMIKIIID